MRRFRFRNLPLSGRFLRLATRLLRSVITLRKSRDLLALADRDGGAFPAFALRQHGSDPVATGSPDGRFIVFQRNTGESQRLTSGVHVYRWRKS